MAQASNVPALLPWISNDALGRGFALSNAVVWAMAMIFFKKSTAHVAPTALNMLKNVIGLLMIGLTIAAIPLLAPGWSEPVPMHLIDPFGRPFWILAVSGIIGIAVADTLFFYSLNLAGVGLTAIADCMYTPFVVLFSLLLLGESIGWVESVGALLIVSAVFVTGSHAPPADRTRKQIVTGVVGAASAVGLMAFGIVLATPQLRGAPVLWTTGIRLLAGVVALTLIAPWIPGWRATLSAFTPSRAWRVTIPGSILGAYVAMLFWVAGFAYTDASVAAMLNQSSTIVALLLATIVLGERMDAMKLLAVALAMAGIGIVTFHEQVRAWVSTVFPHA